MTNGNGASTRVYHLTRSSSLSQESLATGGALVFPHLTGTEDRPAFLDPTGKLKAGEIDLSAIESDVDTLGIKIGTADLKWEFASNIWRLQEDNSITSLINTTDSVAYPNLFIVHYGTYIRFNVNIPSSPDALLELRVRLPLGLSSLKVRIINDPASDAWQIQKLVDNTWTNIRTYPNAARNLTGFIAVSHNNRRELQLTTDTPTDDFFEHVWASSIDLPFTFEISAATAGINLGALTHEQGSNDQHLALNYSLYLKISELETYINKLETRLNIVENAYLSLQRLTDIPTPGSLTFNQLAFVEADGNQADGQLYLQRQDGNLQAW